MMQTQHLKTLSKKERNALSEKAEEVLYTYIDALVHKSQLHHSLIRLRIVK